MPMNSFKFSDPSAPRNFTKKPVSGTGESIFGPPPSSYATNGLGPIPLNNDFMASAMPAFQAVPGTGGTATATSTYRPNPSSSNTSTQRFGSLGNTGNMFGGRMQGTQRDPFEQSQRNQTFQNILSGGGGAMGGMGGGVPNSQNPYNFDNAFRATQDRQNAIQALIGQSRGNVGAVMGQAQQAYQNPTGLDPALLASLRQESQAANAAAMLGMQRDARGQMAASGYSDSPAAAWVDSQIRGQGTQADLQRRNEIGMMDAQARLQNQQRAQDWISQLLGMDTQTAMQGGNLIGQMQTPYLTPEAAGAMGYGNQGGAAVGTPTSQGQGFLRGTLYGNAGSNAQYNTALGNAEYRRRTGQDLPRTYGGQAFFGFR